MTICPICKVRQPGESLCPLHPQASAWRDQRHRNQKKMTQELTPNQLDDICTWVTTHTSYSTPTTTTHILACICDKCANQVTVTLCNQCAQNWVGSAPGSRCGTCNGTLSWQIHDIISGEALTHINPSEL